MFGVFQPFARPEGMCESTPRVCLDLRVKKGTSFSSNMMLSLIPCAAMEDAKHSEIFSRRRSGGIRSIARGSFFAIITVLNVKESIVVLELKPVEVSNRISQGRISQGPLSTVVHGRLGVVEQDGCV